MVWKGGTNKRQECAGGLIISLSNPETSGDIGWGNPFHFKNQHYQELLGTPLATDKQSRPTEKV